MLVSMIPGQAMRTLILLSAAITLGGCLSVSSIAVTPPPPDWTAPGLPSISPTEELVYREGQIPLLTDDLVDTRVIGCDLLVRSTGIQVIGCEFVDSRLLVEGAADLVIENCIFRDRYRREEAAISLYRAIRPAVRNCLIENNYIGIGAHESVGVLIEGCTFRDNDGHNAITIDLGTTSQIRSCFFTNSFPHAVLVGTGKPRGSITIEDNRIEYSVEDAINFENFSSSEPSFVRGNVILHTGWAGINVEYRSWDANLIIENNYISSSGTDLSAFPRHPHQPEPYSEGWKHGILLEDCSGVTVRGNRIVDCEETGIELVNAREIVLESNHVVGCDIGIALRTYNEGLLTRPIFPLPETEAGPSSASAQDNTFERNTTADWQIEPRCEVK